MLSVHRLAVRQGGVVLGHGLCDHIGGFDTGDEREQSLEVLRVMEGNLDHALPLPPATANLDTGGEALPSAGLDLRRGRGPDHGAAAARLVH